MSRCRQIMVCRECRKGHCVICGVNRGFFTGDTKFKTIRKWLYDKVSLEM